eukprot:TRINITY_DN11248_c0_g1_i1.p1 TRINITY_DN11248_c0_g1~~TRINITY_DN11248_c0_g1_i1.p1  ORF type:complete len:201 (+),score=30.23 TRINITY_DN11248_c0_g1_i1:20-622(+)
MSQLQHLAARRPSTYRGTSRCVQCRTPQPTACTAAYAEVAHRPIAMPQCDHGPYCPRCRRSVAGQVLPFCVCRALVDHWRETAWPLGDSAAADVGEAAGSDAGPPSGSREGQGEGLPFASTSFVSWDSFPTTAQSATPMPHTINGAEKQPPGEDEASQKRARIASPLPRSSTAEVPARSAPAGAMAFAAQAAMAARRRKR